MQWVRQELRLRNEETYETGLAVPASTDEDSDIDGRDKRGSESREDGDRRGSGELHGAERNELGMDETAEEASEVRWI